VGAVNALGANLGDDGRSVVSLAEGEVIEAAARATGLEDCGDGWFREPLRILLRALEEEARLTLLGRLLARAEIQRVLQNRLAVEAMLARHPEIAAQPIEAPVVITGLGRTGTTLLHDLLAQDPAVRVPMQWELMYSVPPPDASSYASDPRIERVRREIGVMGEVDPAFPTMHELAADLPTECIYILAHQFASHMFVGEFNVPSYAVWLVTADLEPAYAYHRRFLQLLQWRHRGERWVLKAPSHLSSLPALFRAYPDARVVITHRDPRRVIASLADLMATLQRMRSDHVDYGAMVAGIAYGFAELVQAVMRQRQAGEVPDDRITDVRYADLVADPLGTVAGLYERWGLRLGAAAAARMRARLARPAAPAPAAHDYAFADTGLDRAEQRARFAAYLERYRLPEEV
jgi:hypothetical protein